MPRPRFRRRIGWLPERRYFRPEGDDTANAAEVVLEPDEVEALRLADLEGLHQEEAAESMDISRPTFGRIVESAHRKVADALVNGKAIRFTSPAEGFELNAAPPGPGGYCLCPRCGFQKPHDAGRPAGRKYARTAGQQWYDGCAMSNNKEVIDMPAGDGTGPMGCDSTISRYQNASEPVPTLHYGHSYRHSCCEVRCCGHGDRRFMPERFRRGNSISPSSSDNLEQHSGATIESASATVPFAVE